MSRIRTSLGASAADVALRLVAQMTSTVIIARMLPPEDFGVALMVLSIVGIAGAFVSLPFEEALAQRQRLRMGHLRSVLFVSLLLTVGAVLLALGLGPVLAWATGVEALAFWLPVASLFLLGQGPATIARAIARRQQRFVDLAIANSGSMVLGCAAAIAIAFSGWGIAALVVQRMLPLTLYPLIVALAAKLRGRPFMVLPRWDAQRFRELFRFSWFNLTDVAVDYATPAALTYLVNAFFGTAVLGQMNIAMRMVDPLRSAIDSVGHNIAFSMLSRMQGDPQRLAEASARVVSNVAAVAVPAFLGLAVCAGLLLPLMVGPGWDQAVPIAWGFCITAAVAVPFRYLYSGYSALGRPEWGLMGSTLGLAAMVAWLVAVQRWQIAGTVGLSMLANEIATAVLAVAILLRLAGRAALPELGRVARIWGAGLAMVLLLWGGVMTPLAALPQPVVLGLSILVGIAAYPLFLRIACRPSFDIIKSVLLPRRFAQ